MDALGPSFRPVHYHPVPAVPPEGEGTLGFRRVSLPDGSVAEEAYASFPSPGLAGAFLLGAGATVLTLWLLSRSK